MGEPERPAYKFNNDKQTRYLANIRKGMNLSQAARSVGFTHPGVWEYKKRHPEFRLLEQQAEAEFCFQIEDMLLQNCAKGHFAAQVFWLTNRAEEGRWRDRRAVSQNVTVVNQAPDAAKVAGDLLARLREPEHDGADQQGPA